MVYRPPRNPGLLVGALLALWPLALAALLLVRGLGMEVAFPTFLYYVGAGVLFVVGLLFAYWTYACATLRYMVDRNALAIQWGVTRIIVPLSDIQRLLPGSRLPAPRVRGINWPGYHVGRGQVERVGEVLFYSNHRTKDQVLYVQTSGRNYGITVLDPAAFAATIQEFIRQGPDQQLRQGPLRHGLTAQPFWRDGWARGLTAAGVALNLVVVGYIFARYPGLQDSLPLRFPPLGGVIRVSDKSELLDIPKTASALFYANLALAAVVHLWERSISYLLLGTAVAIQILFVVAALTAVA
jgi:hypothetical protein